MAGTDPDQSRTIRIPVHMNDSLNKFRRASRDLEKELGRTPTNDEIGRRTDIPVEKVRKLKTISRAPVSLETPVGRDGESVLGDLIEDRWVGSPVDAVIEGNVHDDGSTTQLRTLVYDANGRLSTETHPESGLKTYTYNTDGTLLTRVDAKNQQVKYAYDTFQRLLTIKRYPVANGTEDTCSS